MAKHSTISITAIIDGQSFNREASGQENVAAAMDEFGTFLGEALKSAEQKALASSRPKKPSRRSAKGAEKKNP